MVTSGIGDAKPLSITLNTGAQMPAVGLGTWQADPGVIGNVVKAAIQTGYRHIDCATAYRNQKEIGDALQELFKSGEIKREDLFITSKLWVTELDPNEVPHAVDRVLGDLQLDYIDLYLIHWPVALVKDAKDPLQQEHITRWDVEATWRALEKLVEAGKVRAIGVSNFSKKKLQEVLPCAKIPPAVNQVECHPMWQQRELRSFCESKQIHLSAYASMGSAGSRYATVSVLSHPILTEVAENLGKTPAQVALRWGLQMGQSVLPKTVKLERLAQNLDVLSWSIPDDDMDKISTIEQRRFFTVPFSVDHDSINSLWDE